MYRPGSPTRPKSCQSLAVGPHRDRRRNELEAAEPREHPARLAVRPRVAARGERRAAVQIARAARYARPSSRSGNTASTCRSRRRPPLPCCCARRRRKFPRTPALDPHLRQQQPLQVHPVGRRQAERRFLDLHPAGCRSPGTPPPCPSAARRFADRKTASRPSAARPSIRSRVRSPKSANPRSPAPIEIFGLPSTPWSDAVWMSNALCCSTRARVSVAAHRHRVRAPVFRLPVRQHAVEHQQRRICDRLFLQIRDGLHRMMFTLPNGDSRP